MLNKNRHTCAKQGLRQDQAHQTNWFLLFKSVEHADSINSQPAKRIKVSRCNYYFSLSLHRKFFTSLYLKISINIIYNRVLFRLHRYFASELRMAGQNPVLCCSNSPDSVKAFLPVDLISRCYF